MQTIKFVKNPSIGPTLVCEVHHVTNVVSYVIKGFYHPNVLILGRLVEDSHVGGVNMFVIFNGWRVNCIILLWLTSQASHNFILKNHIKMLPLLIKLLESWNMFKIRSVEAKLCTVSLFPDQGPIHTIYRVFHKR